MRQLLTKVLGSFGVYLVEKLFENRMLYQGSEVNAPGGSPAIRWRLNYCTTPGDKSTRYSTILYGGMLNGGTDLHLHPNVDGIAYEFPVSFFCRIFIYRIYNSQLL